jgi:hypothetical protein
MLQQAEDKQMFYRWTKIDSRFTSLFLSGQCCTCRLVYPCLSIIFYSILILTYTFWQAFVRLWRRSCSSIVKHFNASSNSTRRAWVHQGLSYASVHPVTACSKVSFTCCVQCRPYHTTTWRRWGKRACWRQALRALKMHCTGSVEPRPEHQPPLTTAPYWQPRPAAGSNPNLPGLGARRGSATAPSPAAAKEPGCRAAAGLRLWSNKSCCPLWFACCNVLYWADSFDCRLHPDPEAESIWYIPGINQW